MQSPPEYVVLVDSSDRETGTMEKMEAHRKGLLHRAFSVFIFNDKGEMLLQKRAGVKYHSGGLWTNACCGHPRQGENISLAAERRLKEELGIGCQLKKLFSFIYQARLDNELSEHELDHVFIGFINEDPDPDPDEVESFQWILPHEIREKMKNDPSNFTEWFKLCFEELMLHYTQHNQKK
jgi:isopentenyl-diphosphate Delta-isomerase